MKKFARNGNQRFLVFLVKFFPFFLKKLWYRGAEPPTKQSGYLNEPESKVPTCVTKHMINFIYDTALSWGDFQLKSNDIHDNDPCDSIHLDPISQKCWFNMYIDQSKAEGRIFLGTYGHFTKVFRTKFGPGTNRPRVTIRYSEVHYCYSNELLTLAMATICRARKDNHSKCDECIKARTLRVTRVVENVRNAIIIENEHRKDHSAARHWYLGICEQAETKGKECKDRVVSIVIDGAESGKYKMPFTARADTKKISKIAQNRAMRKLVGGIRHGSGFSLWWIQPQVFASANLVCTLLLHQILQEYNNFDCPAWFGRKLHIQVWCPNYYLA